MKKLFVLLMLTFALVSCNNAENNGEEAVKSEENSAKIKVTTSIVPLASIANYIGGEFVEAKALVPAWVSPHGFDLKPNQIVSIEKSDLVVYLNMDHIDGFLNKSLEWKNNVLAVSKWIELLESEAHDHGEEWHEDEHEHEEHSTDPHIWGSSENAYIIAKHILDELIKLNPENKSNFEANFKSFKNELDDAKSEFNKDIEWKIQGNFIVFHDAYNYLFAELNIDNNKKHVFRTSELSDPNSAEMKFLIDEINQLGIKIIFREPQLNSDNLKKLANDYNLNILVLDPLWIDSSKDWYINNYITNLENLAKIYE